MRNAYVGYFCLILLVFYSLLSVTGCRILGSYGNGQPSSSSTLSVGSSNSGKVPSLEEERPAVNAKLNALSSALLAKDVDKAILLCSPGRQESYKEMFQSNLVGMPPLGEVLKKATFDRISPCPDKYGVRFGGISVVASGGTYHISIIQINGEWYFQDL